MACNTESVLANTRTNQCMKGTGKKVCVTAKESISIVLTNSNNLKVKRRYKTKMIMLLYTQQERNKSSTILNSMEALMNCFGTSQVVSKMSSSARMS